MTWRPIETAPRDGTRVIAVYLEGPLGELNWITIAHDDTFGHWIPQGQASNNMYWWRLRNDPTHWQPLPPPPGAET